MNSTSLETLSLKRNQLLPQIIRDIQDDKEISISSLKTTISFLPLYNISCAESQVLCYIVPSIKKRLQKIFEENSFLAETTKEELSLDILKSGLLDVSNLLQISKTTLEFVLQNSEIELNKVTDTLLNMSHLIFFTFQHCKNSCNIYKNNFSKELVLIFQTNQALHSLVFKLFETLIAKENDLNTLIEVSKVICSMNEVLSGVNIKTVADNWKGFISIIQKFFPLIKDHIDLKTPLNYLTRDVVESLLEIEKENAETTVQHIKVASFLIKVFLKLSDIFYESLLKVIEEIRRFCLSILSFPLEYFKSKNVPSQFFPQLDNLIVNSLQPFLQKLALEDLYFKLLNAPLEEIKTHSFGYLHLINTILKTRILQNKTFEQFGDLLEKIFFAFKNSYKELLWESIESQVFDETVTNVSSVLILENLLIVSEIVDVLLKALMGESIWLSLLALEILFSYISYSNDKLQILTELVTSTSFGQYSLRPEKVIVKILIQRIYSSLSLKEKEAFASKFIPFNHLNIWIIVGLEDFPLNLRYLLDNLVIDTVEKLEQKKMFSSIASLDNLTNSLEVISSIDFKQMGLNSRRLFSSILKLWEINLDQINNVTKRFLLGLSKITVTFMTEFSGSQLLNILIKLKELIQADMFCVLLVCNILLSLEELDSGQDEYRISNTISSISLSLVRQENVVIKEIGLETVEKLAKLSEAILNISREVQGVIFNFLQRRLKESFVADDVYLDTLSSAVFKHECIVWKREMHLVKKLKVEEVKLSKEEELEEGLEKEEVIDRIKGEVKCLAKIVKKQKLSSKDIGKIKMIINELHSVMNY